MLPGRRIVAGNNPILGYVYDTFVPSSLINYQSLRWRKPMWLPTAKSKVFRVPVKKPYPKDVFMEYKKLNDQYHTYITSIRKYCIEQVTKNEQVLDLDYLQKLEDEDFERCFKLNQEWNERIAESRRERRAKEKDERAMQILQKMEQMDRQMQLEQELMDAKIRMAKEESKTFITEQNIDQAIEEALSQVVNYNKLMDMNGNMFDPKVKRTKQSQINE